MSTLETYAVGDLIEVLERGSVVNTVRVVRDKRSEIIVEDIRTKEETEFAYYPDRGGWKMLFEGLGGERCVNHNAPTYTLRRVEQKNTTAT